MQGGAEPIAVRGATLFERIGGRAVVERIVADFYDRVERDPELRPIFPEDLSSGREKQTLFLEQWLGGEPRYSERWGHPRLRIRHFPFVITERDAEIAVTWPADLAPDQHAALSELADGLPYVGRADTISLARLDGNRGVEGEVARPLLANEMAPSGATITRCASTGRATAWTSSGRT